MSTSAVRVGRPLARHRLSHDAQEVLRRKVRAWLQPRVMLLRYWRAYTDMPPPEQLEALLRSTILPCPELLPAFSRSRRRSLAATRRRSSGDSRPSCRCGGAPPTRLP